MREVTGGDNYRELSTRCGAQTTMILITWSLGRGSEAGRRRGVTLGAQHQWRSVMPTSHYLFSGPRLGGWGAPGSVISVIEQHSGRRRLTHSLRRKINLKSRYPQKARRQNYVRGSYNLIETGRCRCRRRRRRPRARVIITIICRGVTAADKSDRGVPLLR